VVRDAYGNKVRNIAEEQRYYDILVKAAKYYIRQKQSQFPDHVEFLEVKPGDESSEGYVFFTVDEGIYAIDLRIAEVEYSEEYNITRREKAERKFNRYKEDGDVPYDSTLELRDIIIETEDGKRTFDKYGPAIEFINSEIDKLLRELLLEYLSEQI